MQRRGGLFRGVVATWRSGWLGKVGLGCGALALVMLCSITCVGLILLIPTPEEATESGISSTVESPTAVPLTSAPEPGATALPPTDSPSGLVDIDTPITIDGVQLKVTSARKQHGGLLAIIGVEPGDMALTVRLDVVSGELDKDILDEWDFSVSDENGRTDKEAIVSTWGDSEGTVELMELTFPVDTAAKSFTLHTPNDQTVVLDPILKSPEE